MSTISEALSTLSDRGLRRLLGARTFLRGLDYAKRGVVENVGVEPEQAKGEVKGSDPEAYIVSIGLSDGGITGNCTCPAYQKTNQHCKHIAALLISVRNQARANSPAPTGAASATTTSTSTSTSTPVAAAIERRPTEPRQQGWSSSRAPSSHPTTGAVGCSTRGKRPHAGCVGTCNGYRRLVGASRSGASFGARVPRPRPPRRLDSDGSGRECTDVATAECRAQLASARSDCRSDRVADPGTLGKR